MYTYIYSYRNTLRGIKSDFFFFLFFFVFNYIKSCVAGIRHEEPCTHIIIKFFNLSVLYKFWKFQLNICKYICYLWCTNDVHKHVQYLSSILLCFSFCIVCCQYNKIYSMSHIYIYIFVCLYIYIYRVCVCTYMYV